MTVPRLPTVATLDSELADILTVVAAAPTMHSIGRRRGFASSSRLPAQSGMAEVDRRGWSGSCATGWSTRSEHVGRNVRVTGGGRPGPRRYRVRDHGVGGIPARAHCLVASFSGGADPLPRRTVGVTDLAWRFPGNGD